MKFLIGLIFMITLLYSLKYKEYPIKVNSFSLNYNSNILFEKFLLKDKEVLLLEIVNMFLVDVYNIFIDFWRYCNIPVYYNDTLNLNIQDENLVNKNSWILIDYKKIFTFKFSLKILLTLSITILFLIFRQFLLKKTNARLQNKINFEINKNIQKDRIFFQQAKLANMGEMLNHIAHQWREPLNEINSIIALIDSSLLTNKVKILSLNNNLKKIEDQTFYMSRTVDHFQNYINPDKSKTIFLISQAVNDAVLVILPSFKTLNIHIEVDVIDDKKIYGYCGEYIQVIIAILNNSKDAFINKLPKEALIKIIIARDILIQDNAGGIKDDIVHRIFEPYFSTKLQTNGTGIGLYMSKMIIEQSMNGSLNIIQNSNIGASFKIEV